jgi:hypothetical protein
MYYSMEYVMNLFYLDKDLDKCAEYHVDKHVNKMILEAAQLICTNLWIDDLFGFVPRAITKEENAVLQQTRLKWKAVPMEDRPIPYLPTMQNHPSCIWVRSSLENYFWTNNYAFALASEAHYRYGSIHKSFTMLCNLPEPKNMEDHGFTTFGLAMPDGLKDYDNPIQSYRDFYHLDKGVFASWTHRPKPPWWNEDFADYEKRISGQ